MRDEIRKIHDLMEEAQYVTDAPVATAVHLAMTLRKPLLIEGHAGVGKTEVAKVMARMLKTNLIRLQCYEGLDAATSLYEWNYQKQLLHIKLSENSARPAEEKEEEIFSESFLLRRPLLQAISQEFRAPVLLVDEVDRCVAAKTLVATATGAKRAEQIQPGDELLSFDPDDFRLTRSLVSKVIPREVPDVVRILAGGRLIEVTPEHRFVRYVDSGYEVVHAEDLCVDDRLPLHKHARLADEREPQFAIADDIVKLTDDGRRQLYAGYRASGKTYAELAVAAGVSRSHLRNVVGPTPCRASLRREALARLMTELPFGVVMDDPAHCRGVHVQSGNALYEVLGYIVADGCFTSDRLCIADKDRTNLEIYAAKFEEAFGVAPRILPGPHRNWELTFHSLPLGRFLRRILGAGLGRSRTRLVPDFVFSLPAERRAAFVRGYLDGEGWVSDHQVAASSASPQLLADVQHLLSSLGVESFVSKTRVHPGNFGKGPYYTLTITDLHRFAAIVGFCSRAKRDRLGERRAQAWTVTETLPRERVTGVLDRLRTSRVLHGTPRHQTVHDILAGRVRPNVSSLRRIAEAFGDGDLNDLLHREVVLGEVTSIERLPATQPVYDFVLEGQPYFVANQIVTHNCDEEFEAFMLEVFSDWQVTIPEIGTIKATHPPHVVLTSNRTRELSDALRRRCLYLWIDYPTFDKELRIIQRKVGGLDARLAREVARFMEALRRMRLAKVPGVAETLDWAQALAALHADYLDEEVVAETLGCILKDADDMKRFKAEVAKAGLTPFLPVQG